MHEASAVLQRDLEDQVLYNPNVQMILYQNWLHRPGIEPGSQEWESCMIPLHQRCYSTIFSAKCKHILHTHYACHSFSS